MFVLDVLHYDIETLDHIIRILNDESEFGWRDLWQRDFSHEEVTSSLAGLIHDRLVQPLVYDDRAKQLEEYTGEISLLISDPSQYWFTLTLKGREKWREWSEGGSNGPGPGPNPSRAAADDAP